MHAALRSPHLVLVASISALAATAGTACGGDEGADTETAVTGTAGRAGGGSTAKGGAAGRGASGGATAGGRSGSGGKAGNANGTAGQGTGGGSVAGAAGASTGGAGGGAAGGGSPNAGAGGTAAGGAGGGASGAGGTPGGSGTGGTGTPPPPPPDPPPPPPDPLPTSQRFDIDSDEHKLFTKKLLHDPHHVMQGFAVNQKIGRMYVAQLRDGAAYDGDDLCITEMTLDGKETGHMYHNNAGHGVSIGVEAVGNDSYLWVEDDVDKSSQRGTSLLRFKFQDGKTPAGTKHFKGSDTITAATDPINGRIAIRRKESGGMTFRLLTFADAREDALNKQLAKFVQPDLDSPNPTFQGYTIFGSYLYTLDGEGHDNPKAINSYITRINMKNGKKEDRRLTKVGDHLDYREPEGMAVYQSGSTPRLLFGFGARDGGGPNRYANVYFLDQFEK